MKKIAWIFLALISCSKKEDTPCEEVNKGYITRLNNAKGINQKQQNLLILNQWIKEIRSYKCSPETYYKYYEEINNVD
ncbi:hypothetical protein [Wenyingzhuangia marina]|uniref:Uncharacterized protein n=1 Tax=Wenyingzhuangia marina TaxID=1195760 RepID=A0A1M5U0P8_9FLAO|nr:hypothetical protein [Wenyingzhuangia marina]GGF70181.1 hypothetical protein GCM10011397_11390 [Wenyingzhuangia marina]SHH56446.1 hypothetical protein SAMN05444281_0956 [Wenyingzhuangia marina]